jgi:hypothetical protein
MTDDIEKDTTYSPGSDTDTQRLQDDAPSSPALDDPDIDESAVKVLPGTGGPDDEGDVTMDEKA